MPNLVIARTISVDGEAYAHNTLGELRVLGAGDVLMEGETVFTAESSEVQLELMNGLRMEVHESSRREMLRDLLAETPSKEQQRPRASARAQGNSSRFYELDDGGAVQSAAGLNVYFNQRPMYWQLSEDATRAQAIVHMPTDNDFIDVPVLEISLSGDGFCEVLVETGEFAVESHNIPFTTGDPEPGVPVKFFGISEGGDGKVVGDSIVCSAEISSIGVTNNWYLDDDKLIFEFLSESSDLAEYAPLISDQPDRAINNFSFRNTRSTSATFMVRAYSGARELVYEAGSEQAPIKLATGAVFSVISQQHYDRLELIPVEGCDSCRKLSLHMEGFSEFAVEDVPLEMTITGFGAQGEAAQGAFCFDVLADGRGHSELCFETSAEEVAYDSVWEQLGLQSNLAPGEQH
jgi:hypothetical protein